MNALFNNRFELIRQVGEGGYGVVWHACDTFNDTEVAIKIYKSSVPFDIMERARKEYAIGRSLYHPNILPLYDLNYCVESLYIVMPYCSFGSIDKLCGKVSEQVVWRIIKDISSGLEYLHNCGIMHLDIKPANILFDSQSRYVISDFGLSHRAADLILFYDKAMTFGGTAYLAPERFDSNMRIDTYSDIWSLGVSIYELVTGELPFHGWGGKQQLADRILPLKCDKCSKELSNLIDACISPYPQNRPSATEIIALADAVIAGQSDIPLFNILSDDSILKSTCIDTGYFYNTYNESILNAMKCFKIAKSTDKSLYGIVDDKGKVIVDFLYDEIHNIGEYCWPGPGPLPPRECFFIGAFFRQGDDAGYLIIKDDGNIGEYRRCSYEEYVRRCQFS